MQWHEFIDKLSTAKKRGINNSMSVACIANLIYAGAFDGMLETPPVQGEMLPTYEKMFYEVRTALKSQASLPKKPKNEPLGLQDLQTDMQLALWRFSSNPISKFDFLPSCEENLRQLGFTPNKHPSLEYRRDFPYKHDGNRESFVPVKSGLVKTWSVIFQKEHAGVLKHLFAGKLHVAMVGVITKSKKLYYHEGTKQRLVASIYTGYEEVGDLTVWPKKSSGKLPSYISSMKEGDFGVMIVQPRMWNGRRTGTIINWFKFAV